MVTFFQHITRRKIKILVGHLGTVPLEDRVNFESRPGAPLGLIITCWRASSRFDYMAPFDVDAWSNSRYTRVAPHNELMARIHLALMIRGKQTCCIPECRVPGATMLEHWETIERGTYVDHHPLD